MNLQCSSCASSDEAGITAAADGSRWIAAGALTFDTAAELFAAAQSLPLPASGVVDCAGIAAVDSSAVALLLSMRRRAAEAGMALSFEGVPPPLASLAQLYGVEAFIEP